MTSREKKASEMFKCSDKERGIFEAGIKFGTIVHQFVGTPVSNYNVRELEKVIEMSIMVQPLVESVKVNIDIDEKERKDLYDYVSLTNDMIRAMVKIRIGSLILSAERCFKGDDPQISGNESSDRERAIVESGISMGLIYHQFVGTPVSRYNVSELERAIELSVKSQPFVRSAKVRLILGDKGKKDCVPLAGEMIDAVVKVRIGSVNVTAEMRYNDVLEYPLMYVSAISQ
jgi:hypothetical protein